MDAWQNTPDGKSSNKPIDPQKGADKGASIRSVSNSDIPVADMHRVLPRQVSTGVSRGVQAQGSRNFQMNPGNAQQVVNDGTTNRVLLGNTVGDWGLKVSKPGFDVTTATNEQLIFNSSQNVFKIVQGPKQVTVTCAAGSTIGNASVAHGLEGFVPIPMGFLNGASISTVGSNLSLPLPSFGTATIDTTNHVIDFGTWLFVTADETYFHATVLNSTGSAVSYIVTYYLLQESAST